MSENNESTSTESKISLTPKDLELIQAQCELQGATSEEEINGFTKAYTKAKDFALNDKIKTGSPDDILELINELIALTEPYKYKGSYRKVPVTFASGDRGLHPEQIPDQMKKWAEAFTYSNQDPDLLYKLFEEIHPFEDGNGRVGDLLWKIDRTKKTGSWPEELPPDVFKQNVKPPQSSAFGEIE